ncbi:MAG: hypothetical protein RIR43_762, partial [Pseudomonadota bacterium]
MCALVACAVGLPAPAWAQQQVPSDARQPAAAREAAAAKQACQPDESLSLEDALARLPDCQDSASWLAWVGERLNRADRPAEALDHLERALLLDPDLVPAQLGYLLALAATGDTQAALSYAQNLLQSGQLPAALAQPLAQRVARWQAQTQPTWAIRMGVGARLGYDSNLLGAPNMDSLTLILGGQAVQLPLESSYRSQGGSYLRMDANAEATRALDSLAPGLRLDVSAQLRRRLSPSVPQSDLTQAQLAAELSRSGLWYASASAGALDSALGAGGSRYRTLGAGAGLQWTFATCEARTGAELQQRRMQSNPTLSGRYSGALLALQCEPRDAGATAQAPQGPQGTQGNGVGWPAVMVQLAQGTDQPLDAARPGGAQRQTLLRLTALRGSWLADVELEQRRDATPYSALLGDSVRRVARKSARLEWQPALGSQLGAGLQARLGLEWSRQSSNLVLFGARSWG